MQVLSIYNRGLLMKEVNQTSRTITDQMQRTVSASTPPSTFNNQTFIIVSGITAGAEDRGGRFCPGNYSYVWNYAKTIKDNISTPNTIGTGASAKKVRFARVPDKGGNLCIPDASTGALPAIATTAEAVELLGNSTYGLQLYNLSVTSNTNSYNPISSQRLYFIDITLGTSDNKAISAGSGSRQCKAPAESGSDQNFCSVNNFSFIARAGNM